MSLRTDYSMSEGLWMMNEETRNLLIKELTKKSIERGGYILKMDLYSLLKMN